MDIKRFLDKDNLHHAYLIEGQKEIIVPELFEFIKDMGIDISANPDFCHISLDSFKIDDARNLKSVQYEKGISESKKIYIISANNFLLEAQNALLKIFEEPIKNTHFFLIVPNKNSLLKTLISRFYVISSNQTLSQELIDDAEKFIKMPIKNRIDFIKEFLSEESNEDEEKSIEFMGTRAKALNFLNAIEFSIHQKIISEKYNKNSIDIFGQIFKVRDFLNQPGTSLKTLMESIALLIPNF